MDIASSPARRWVGVPAPGPEAWRAVAREPEAVTTWVCLLAHSVHAARLLGHSAIRVAVVGALSVTLRDALAAAAHEMSHATGTSIRIVEPPLDAPPADGPIGLVVADGRAELGPVAAQPWKHLLPRLPVWTEPLDARRSGVAAGADIATDDASTDARPPTAAGPTADGEAAVRLPQAPPDRVLASPVRGSEHEGARLVLHALDHPGRATADTPTDRAERLRRLAAI